MEIYSMNFRNYKTFEKGYALIVKNVIDKFPSAYRRFVYFLNNFYAFFKPIILQNGQTIKNEFSV